MSDILTSLEAALDQARQELGSIQRVGRALTPWEDARASRLRQVTALVQEALDVLRPDAGPEVDEADNESFPAPEPAADPGADEPDASDAVGLAGNDDTDDY